MLFTNVNAATKSMGIQEVPCSVPWGNHYVFISLSQCVLICFHYKRLIFEFVLPDNITSIYIVGNIHSSQCITDGHTACAA